MSIELWELWSIRYSVKSKPVYFVYTFNPNSDHDFCFFGYTSLTGAYSRRRFVREKNGEHVNFVLVFRFGLQQDTGLMLLEFHFGSDFDTFACFSSGRSISKYMKPRPCRCMRKVRTSAYRGLGARKFVRCEFSGCLWTLGVVLQYWEGLVTPTVLSVFVCQTREGLVHRLLKMVQQHRWYPTSKSFAQ